MTVRYKMVRMPMDVYNKYSCVQKKMELDLKRFTGKKMQVPMPKVFNAVVNPEFNENYVEISLAKLAGVARRKKK